MKHQLKTLVLLCAVLGAALASPAAVPLRWTVETSRLQPAVFDVVRGETLNLEAAFQSYGKPLSMAAKPCAIFYQTNGMGSAWWTAPATVRTAAALSGSSTNAVTNVVAATFTPAMDPGATGINGFLGSTGDIYRAAFTLRYRHGPGETPNALPIPPPSINWANVANVNVDAAPFVVKGGSGGLTTTDVTNIVDAVVASSNLASVAYVDTSSATTLASANAYTTAVSNDFHVTVTNLDAMKRDLTNNVCAVTLFSEWDFNRYSDYQFRLVFQNGHWELYIKSELESEYHDAGTYIGGENDTRITFYDGEQGLPEVLTRYWATASNEMFMTYSPITNLIEQATNGLVTASVTNAVATEVRGKVGQSDVDATIVASNLCTAASISNVFPVLTNVYTKAETETASTIAATSVFAEIADYALTNLATAAYTLRTSEIGNYETTANFTLTLQFADNGRSGDCLLYVANTDDADHEMSLSPDSYTYVSADLAAAKTLKAATTNLVMFTRVTTNTVLVSKTEVK